MSESNQKHMSKRYIILIGIIVIIIIGVLNDATLVAKISILERNDHEIYGGLGNQTGPLGCSSDLFVEPNSSLSFKCGTTDGFGDWVYVFSSWGTDYACPNDVFSSKQCLKCDECSMKIDQLEQLEM